MTLPKQVANQLGNVLVPNGNRERGNRALVIVF